MPTNKLFYSLVAGVAGLYFYDVQFNQGHNVEALGLYNWNAPAVSASNFGVSASGIDDWRTPNRARDQAESLYAAAYGKVVSAQKKAGDSISSWSESSKSEFEKQLAEAQADLNSAQKKVQQYGESAVAEAKKKYEASISAIKASFGSSKQSAEKAYNSALIRLKVVKEEASNYPNGQDKQLIEEAQQRVDLARENVLKYGEKALSEAEKQYTRSVEGLNFKLGKTQQSTSDAYAKALGRVNVANQMLAEAKEDVSVWGKARQAAAQDQLDEAQNQLIVAHEGLTRFGQNAVAQAQQQFEDASEKARSLIGSTQEAAEDAYRRASEQVKDAQTQVNEAANSGKSWLSFWGKSSNEAAREKLSEAEQQMLVARESLQRYGSDVVDDVSKKSGRLSDYLNAQYGATKESAQEAYEAALGRAYVAQEKVNEVGNGVFSWFGGKSSQAKAQLAQAQAELADAKESASQYGSDVVEDAQKKYESYVHSIKSGFGSTKESAIDAYEKAAAALDSAQNQVGSQAKDNLAHAEENLALAKDNAAKYGKDVVRDAQKHYEELKANAQELASAASTHAQDQYDTASSKAKGLYNKATDVVKDSYASGKKVVGDSITSSQQAAENSYDQALKQVEEAQKKVDESKRGWFRWGKGQKNEAEKQLEKAQQSLSESQAGLQKYGKDVIKQAQKKYYSAKENLNSATESAKDNIGSATSAVQENIGAAADYVKDTADSAVHSVQDQYSSLFGKDGHLQVKSKEAAQEVADYYNAQLKSAQENFENAQSNWNKWKDESSKSMQKEADSKYHYFRQKDAEARKKLSEFGDGSKANLDRVVQAQKDGLDSAHKHAQGVLGRVQDWLRG
ncbi:hypothetical protein FOA43_000958 [Brettanomyces nanus]|uniref:Uncharacterized protein n=1 Tax=Eeniella nana TaxID=13502 RepID=A0A875RX91_EENNA|nr:uncharacterized protein FOA43_000958 [Brettanomyces nanus]QPG73646.1 hypothetical protein FOA43_000958 [Brettanomyces nanus]